MVRDLETVLLSCCEDDGGDDIDERASVLFWGDGPKPSLVRKNFSRSCATKRPKGKFKKIPGDGSLGI